MFNLHPTTGIRVVKKTGVKPVNNLQPNSLDVEILFEGQAIIDDKTDSSTPVLTKYGLVKGDYYAIYIPNNALANPITKQESNKLEVYFSESEMHMRTDFVESDVITLKVASVFKPNRIFLDYTTLICQI